MRLLDSLEVQSHQGRHFVELYHGDLSNMPPEHTVDLLIVSAFPGDYAPTGGTLIRALDQQGVSVKALAGRKAADLRESFGCWLSDEIQSDNPAIQFARILVFEPLTRGRPADVVGGIFQSLMPFIHADPFIRTIAMPLVATGNQRSPKTEMLIALLDAAVNWLKLGLPVTRIKIVEYSEMKAAELKGAFEVLKRQYSSPLASAVAKTGPTYDFFISYSHQNTDEVEYLYEALNQSRPGARIFLDRKKLNVGAAWQQELYETLDDCRKVVAVYSPDYLLSKVCKEEYNIALLRHRESETGVLVPVFLYSTELPTYMKLIQFIDCREGDRSRLQEASQEIWNA